MWVKNMGRNVRRLTICGEECGEVNNTIKVRKGATSQKHAGTSIKKERATFAGAQNVGRKING